ncbi:11327_t:CDS:2 [Paraglomus brasilianum]|uniref:11327_t:CDS:1 n=1 Tax=Paraglomus brasilianum TaxID=144538 RepID=A0A9N9AF27_9GLOM|nr:11327_t:CDS:2 [Paraglomus brasilianum]
MSERSIKENIIEAICYYSTIVITIFNVDTDDPSLLLYPHLLNISALPFKYMTPFRRLVAQIYGRSNIPQKRVAMQLRYLLRHRITSGLMFEERSQEILQRGDFT